MKHTISIGLLTLIVAGCASSRSSSSEEDAQLYGKLAGISSQTLQTATFEFDWVLDNTSGDDITIQGANWTLNIGPDKTFRGTQPYDNLVVGSGDTKTGTIKAEVSFNYSIDTLKWHRDQPAMEYHMVATFDLVGTDIAGIAEWHDKMPPPRAPRLIVEGGGDRDKDEIELDFQVGLMNENPFEVPVDELYYTLTLGDRQIDEGRLIEDPQVIQPSSSLYFELKPKINKKSLPRNQNAFTFRLEAYMRMGELEQRVPLSGVIDFSQ